MEVVLCKVNGDISVVEVNDYSDYEKFLGGFEIVRTHLLRSYFRNSVVMVVDDYGFGHGKEYNPIASYFYDHVIVGDVIFVPEFYGEFVEFGDIDLFLETLEDLKDYLFV